MIGVIIMLARLINQNLFRMRRSASTYIVIGAFAAFMAMIFTVMLGTQMIASGKAEFNEVSQNITTGGLFQYVISGDVLCLFVAIGTAVFVHGEISNGNLKNIYGKVPQKYMLVASKIAAILPLILIFVAIGLISSVAASLIFPPHSIDFGENAWNLVRFTLTHILMLTAAASLTVCVNMLTQSTMATLIASFLFCQFGIAITSFITEQIHRFSEFTLSDYTLLGNMYAITPDSTGTDCLRAAIVSIVIIAATVFVGAHAISHSDIK